VLSRLRIAPDGRIIVYVRSLRSIWLRSVRLDDPRPSRPENCSELLERLIQKSGKDRLICAHCFRFFDFNFEETLQQLTIVDD
jgi:hypothetical protein